MKIGRLALIAVLALSLVSCGGQPTISATDAIKLAKDATKNIAHPPTIYYIDNHQLGYDVDMRPWPDQPGSNSSTYLAGGANSTQGYYLPMTNTTMVSRDFWGSGVYVSFSSQWLTDRGAARHSWKFYVTNDGVAKFDSEDGDRLPPTIELNSDYHDFYG